MVWGGAESVAVWGGGVAFEVLMGGRWMVGRLGGFFWGDVIAEKKGRVLRIGDGKISGVDM